jgi:hypothetical protein
MIYVLNIALIVLSIGSTLAAFGGETWTKGSEPMLQRITRRGWASILLMTLTLSLGTTKELLSRREAVVSAKRLEEALADNQKLKVQIFNMQEALTAEIRSTTRGPIRTVAYLVVDMNGALEQSVVGEEALRFGDRVFYTSDCRGPTRSVMQLLLGVKPPQRPTLTLVVNEEEAGNLRASGEFVLQRPSQSVSIRSLTMLGPYSIALRNPYKLRGCRVDFYVNSTDPLRRIVDQRLADGIKK